MKNDGINYNMIFAYIYHVITASYEEMEKERDERERWRDRDKESVKDKNSETRSGNSKVTSKRK